jgi:hypothetical protein
VFIGAKQREIGKSALPFEATCGILGRRASAKCMPFVQVCAKGAFAWALRDRSRPLNRQASRRPHAHRAITNPKGKQSEHIALQPKGKQSEHTALQPKKASKANASPHKVKAERPVSARPDAGKNVCQRIALGISAFIARLGSDGLDVKNHITGLLFSTKTVFRNAAQERSPRSAED